MTVARAMPKGGYRRDARNSQPLDSLLPRRYHSLAMMCVSVRSRCPEPDGKPSRVLLHAQRAAQSRIRCRTRLRQSQVLSGSMVLHRGAAQAQAVSDPMSITKR
jgi:hypothetical protein